jgi:hypothetical protein
MGGEVSDLRGVRVGRQRPTGVSYAVAGDHWQRRLKLCSMLDWPISMLRDGLTLTYTHRVLSWSSVSSYPKDPRFLPPAFSLVLIFILPS